ncbi:hypothetical protein [Roseibium sediminicola]|uniref:Uncharacterized protein n=1 Tax=Roseibium sediminicola TaxID=2933272 RepID=A0ABT0GNI6_9HYPH|nr:hypothetical protein [Roseibium sp. CAU 1639]MCK7610989.1 hypothetical protein [Roseibium sp. CAU 1639]
MTIRNTLFALLAGGLTAATLATATAAQDKIAPADVAGATDGRPDRYSLVAVDGDILRVDRQNGTVSVCRQRNDAWRCNPVPLAEEAYLAEINELAGEVDRLTARLEEIDSGAGGDERQLPPGSALDRPQKEKDGKSPLTSEDEEELDKMLTFTESAMRRFFGMVRDLQKDFDGDGN